MAGVRITGVEPDSEPLLNRTVRAISAGRYLRSGDRDAAVIGQKIAERLRVGVDDDLMVTTAAQDGELRSAMLKIVGITRTGSPTIDAQVCQIPLPDMERLCGIPGASEISILLDDARQLDSKRTALTAKVHSGDAVLTWIDVLPELKAGAEIKLGFTRLFVGIILAVVILGIAGAQLASALERRREFAVLSALGMKEIQIVRLFFVEAVALGIAGGTAGLLFGFPAVWYLATMGIDFGKLAGADLTVSNVMFDTVFRADMGYWLIPASLGIALVSTLIATFYPAWYAARTDPASALRTAQ
jgi:putative ABC transport system permease protein